MSLLSKGCSCRISLISGQFKSSRRFPLQYQCNRNLASDDQLLKRLLQVFDYSFCLQMTKPTRTPPKIVIQLDSVFTKGSKPNVVDDIRCLIDTVWWLVWGVWWTLGYYRWCQMLDQYLPHMLPAAMKWERWEHLLHTKRVQRISAHQWQETVVGGAAMTVHSSGSVIAFP